MLKLFVLLVSIVDTILDYLRARRIERNVMNELNKKTRTEQEMRDMRNGKLRKELDAMPRSVLLERLQSMANERTS